MKITLLTFPPQLPSRCIQAFQTCLGSYHNVASIMMQLPYDLEFGRDVDYFEGGKLLLELQAVGATFCIHDDITQQYFGMRMSQLPRNCRIMGEDGRVGFGTADVDTERLNVYLVAGRVVYAELG